MSLTFSKENEERLPEVEEQGAASSFEALSIFYSQVTQGVEKRAEHTFPCDTLISKTSV